MVSLGDFNSYFTKTQIDPACPVSFMKRDRFLKIETADEITKKAYQGFGSTINIIGKIVVRIPSKGWDAKDQQRLSLKGQKEFPWK